MLHWIHHLFNPHCEHCRLEKQEEKECPNCIILKQLLDTEKFENKQLLDRILFVPSINERNEAEEPIRPILPKSITSLKMRREMLETEDRVKNQKLQEKEREVKSTEQLETELGIPAVEDLVNIANRR